MGLSEKGPHGTKLRTVSGDEKCRAISTGQAAKGRGIWGLLADEGGAGREKKIRPAARRGHCKGG